MKKSTKRLALNRDTVRSLTAPELHDAAAAAVTIHPCITVSCRFSCNGTCAVSACLPSCGNCTDLC